MDAISPGFDDDWAAFADSALGGGLSPQVEALIAQAGLLRDRPLEALPLQQHVLVRREKGDDSETGTAYPVRGWIGGAHG